MRARLLAWSLPIAILWPSLVWLALDRTVWPWDQAWYARHSVELFEVLHADPLEWPAAMARAAPSKPPAIAWIGQFFVPLGVALGSVDAALLLSVWACHLVALTLVFRALLDLCGGRIAVASAGTLVAGAAPLFIVLSTQYLAEASQTLAVAWFVLIMARAARWSRSHLAAQLVAATCFAMLAKTTSPLYCAAPGLVALVHLFRRSPSSALVDDRRRWAWWALALLLATATTAWYGRNFQAAAHHATVAGFGPVAELFGEREPFVRTLAFWSRTASSMFFLSPVALLVGALALLGAANRIYGRPKPHGSDIGAAAAAVQSLVALAVFALSPNRDPRYLAPLLPLVAVMVSWTILNCGFGWAAPVAIGALGLQLVSVQTQFLGLWPGRPAPLRAAFGVAPTLSLLHRDGGPAAELVAIVQRTCGRGGFGADNFVGVDLGHLSGHSLTYAAAKERLAGRAGECRYHSIGFDSLESARATLNAREYVYWITVDPQVRPIPPEHAFANRTAPVAFLQLRRRGILKPEHWNGPAGVLLYRFVKH